MALNQSHDRVVLLLTAAFQGKQRPEDRFLAAYAAGSLALSGSNQARKGRLVDALAARGDEGRDTLR